MKQIGAHPLTISLAEWTKNRTTEEENNKKLSEWIFLASKCSKLWLPQVLEIHVPEFTFWNNDLCKHIAHWRMCFNFLLFFVVAFFLLFPVFFSDLQWTIWDLSLCDGRWWMYSTLYNVGHKKLVLLRKQKERETEMHGQFMFFYIGRIRVVSMLNPKNVWKIWNTFYSYTNRLSHSSNFRPI